MSNSRVKIKED